MYTVTEVACKSEALLGSENHATGYASQQIWCLYQARINWEGCGRKGIRLKNRRQDGGGSLISPDGVAPSQIVGVSASDIFPCTIKSRRSFLLAPAHLGDPGKRAVERLWCVVVVDIKTV